MIISVDAEKAIDKIEHSLLFKTLSEGRIQGSYLNQITALYNKSTADIILNEKRLKAAP